MAGRSEFEVFKFGVRGSAQERDTLRLLATDYRLRPGQLSYELPATNYLLPATNY